SRAARGHEPGESASLSGEFSAPGRRRAGPVDGPLRAWRLRVAARAGAARARRRCEACAHRARRTARPARSDGRHRGVGQSGADRRALDGIELSTKASLKLGDVMPMLSSATGLLFAAYLPRSKTAAMIARELADT
ncbi:hypothetical protein SB778_35560, partial [Paraburkholderia sp. SIMBA_050]